MSLLPIQRTLLKTSAIEQIQADLTAAVAANTAIASEAAQAALVSQLAAQAAQVSAEAQVILAANQADRAEAAQEAVALLSIVSGVFSDATLAAAVAAGVAALQVGDSFAAVGGDVLYVGIYLIEAGPVGTQIAQLATEGRLDVIDRLIQPIDDDTGVIDFMAQNPTEPYLRQLLGRFLSSSGHLSLGAGLILGELKSVLDGSRWQHLWTAGGKILMGFDYRGRARMLLDEASIAFITANSTAAGAIAPDDLPVIGARRAQAGTRGLVESVFWADGNIGPLVYRQPAAGGLIFPSSGGVGVIGTSTGQSLVIGGGAVAGSDGDLTAVCPYPELILRIPDAKGTRGDMAAASTVASAVSFAPALEFRSSDTGETPATQTMAAVQRGLVEHGLPVRPMAYRSHASGGVAMAVIKKGGTGPHYLNGELWVEKAAGIFASYGYSACIVPAVDMIHGESDRALGTVRATYAADLEQLAADYNADYPGITGQTDPVYLNLIQLAAGTKGNPGTGQYADGASAISQAQLDAEAADPLIQIAAPGYIFPREYDVSGPSYDSVHLSAVGTKLAAEYLGRARVHNARFATKFRPLRMSADLDSAVIDVTFTGGVGPVQVFSDSWLPLHPSLGFFAGSDSGAATITSVAFTGPRTLRLTLSAALAGANPYVMAGYKDATASAADGYSEAFTNICDSEPAMSITLPGRPLPNFLLTTKIAL